MSPLDWFTRFFWPREAISDIQANTAFTRELARVINTKSDRIMEEIAKMAVNIDQLSRDVQTLAQGYQALQTENAQLKDELANADASAQARVDAAVAAEDADAQAKIDAADQVVQNVLNPPAGQ
jgi:outer membrane murein-binding lipoprotein Lpp